MGKLRAMKVAVSGTSGLIGSALCQRLHARGDAIVRLGRAPYSPADLDGADAVVHLGGASIGDGRWTRARKRELYDSRVGSTDSLARAIAAMTPRPSVLLCASGVGYYGATDVEVDETAPRGDDFLARLSGDWEAAAAPARDASVRVVHARFGLVLSKAGGALAKMLPMFRRGLGARLGDGAQPFAWIAIDDAIAALELLLTPPMAGPVNLVAPEQVTQAAFADELARALGTRVRLRVPSLLLRVGLGELATSLTTGARVVPRRLVDAGFVFRHPTLAAALRSTIAS